MRRLTAAAVYERARESGEKKKKRARRNGTVWSVEEITIPTRFVSRPLRLKH